MKRQRIKELEKKRREDNLSIYLNKKKEEEINKTNYLLQKNKIGKSKEKNLNNSNSMISNKTYDKNKKEKISNVINKNNHAYSNYKTPKKKNYQIPVKKNVKTVSPDFPNKTNKIYSKGIIKKFPAKKEQNQKEK